MSLRTVAEQFAVLLARKIYGGIGAIFCLHRIVPEEERSALPDNRALEIRPESLREMLAWVAGRGIEVIALDQVPERLARPRGGKFACFTFDDGYRDNLTQALPVFREFGMPFAVHVSPGLIDGTAGLWWYQIEAALRKGGRLDFAWRGQGYGWPAGSPDAFSALAKMIRAQPGEAREDLVAAICAAAGIDAPGLQKRLMMTWEEVRRLAAEPLVTIGAHTVTHPVLRLMGEAEALAEMADSKRQLEAQLGGPVRHLAFPFGGANAVGSREFRLAGEAAFSTATTTRCANLFPAHARHLTGLPRLTVSGNFFLPDRVRKLESGLLSARERKFRRVVVE